MKRILVVLSICLVSISLQAQNITSVSNSLQNTSSECWEVLRLVNIERVNSGLHILLTTDKMQWMTDVRAKEQIEYYSHTRPSGESCYTVMQECSLNYTYAAENIAMGQTSAEAVMTAWMNSTGHRANILSSNMTLIGAGLAPNSSGYKHWVQMFANTANCYADEGGLTEDGYFIFVRLNNGMVAYAPYDPSVVINKGGRGVLNFPSSQDIYIDGGQATGQSQESEQEYEQESGQESEQESQPQYTPEQQSQYEQECSPTKARIDRAIKQTIPKNSSNSSNNSYDYPQNSSTEESNLKRAFNLLD